MRVRATEVISAPASQVFELSQDYSRRLEWDPFLREARLLNGAGAAGVGVRSWCVTWFGSGMESEYVSFNPPKVVAVKMTRGSWMFRQFAASWNFHDAAENRTSVTFLYSFRVHTALWLLTPLVRAFFMYEMRRRLRGLKTACEVAGQNPGSRPEGLTPRG